MSAPGPHTLAHPPAGIREGLSRIVGAAGPITEAEVEAMLASAGLQPFVTFRARSYAAWLRALPEPGLVTSRSPWGSVPEAVASGRAQLLDALGARADATIPCSRLQVARDIGVVLGAFLASGAAIAVPVRGGFSRAQVLRHGLRHLLRRPALLPRVLRDAWRIDLHTNDRLIDRFTADAWHSLYATLEEVMTREPWLDAVVGTAWYYDAAVSRVSPHLRYLRVLPSSASPLFIDLPPTPADTTYALKRSGTRRAAAEAGRYRPHATLLYWPRGINASHWAPTAPHAG